MTVRELIVELRSWPGELEVLQADGRPIIDVELENGGVSAWLELVAGTPKERFV